MMDVAAVMHLDIASVRLTQILTPHALHWLPTLILLLTNLQGWAEEHYRQTGDFVDVTEFHELETLLASAPQPDDLAIATAISTAQIFRRIWVMHPVVVWTPMDGPFSAVAELEGRTSYAVFANRTRMTHEMLGRLVASQQPTQT